MVRPSSIAKHKPHNFKHKQQQQQQQPHLSSAYICNLVKQSIQHKHPLYSNTECFNDHNNMQQPPSQPKRKKQVRKRTYTSKPHQQQFLNMAEARREIAIALKFHRATMKLQQEAATAAAEAEAEAASDLHSITLPNQTLGLNLNFQDFENLQSSNSFISSSSSSSSLLSSTSSSAVMSRDDLHHAMDEDEIEKIKCLSEQYQMEWNDTMNVLMSTWWFEFLNTNIEIEPQGDNFDFEFDVFDQVMEVPPW
ncbi:hypothetical protein QVD17_29863 [Tagetes erecta]|uniref:Uncharacterized protein n=1 Tax=Tagetes erecta TaxID=13708 RepID=A0AAD8NMI3_TARER|nr:hypothetical protein QVD17_29863 [Tagetes erecta]